jgi:hypothetical protein
MGEANRRKRLDPNFGQPRQNPVQQTVFEFAQTQYQKRGRGMVIFPAGAPGQVVVYVPIHYSGLNDDYRSLIATYEPESELVFNYPLSSTDLDGAWVAEIIDQRRPEAQLRITVAAEGLP